MHGCVDLSFRWTSLDIEYTHSLNSASWMQVASPTGLSQPASSFMQMIEDHLADLRDPLPILVR